MGHRGLLNSALRVNGRQLSQRHAQPSTFLISLSRDLSHFKPPSRRSHSSAAPAPQPQPQQQEPSTTATINTSSSSSTISVPAATRDHGLANPPPTTRPPPLTLPSRPTEAAGHPFLSQANFSYLFAQGMAYLSFYKTGMKHIYTNTRLLYSKRLREGTGEEEEEQLRPPRAGTRAHMHLKLRWAHDVRRLPLFALILIVCGEFTPLVVLALPRAVPLPCRIPRQVEKLEKEDQRWREEGRKEVVANANTAGNGGGDGGDKGGGGGGEQVPPVTGLAKILGLPVRWWTPQSVLQSKVERRLRFLDEDDELLVRAGGAEVLVPEEVKLACADRGIVVMGRGAEELRGVLGRWLRLTDARRIGEQGRRDVVMRLLLREESEWEQ
ncbi:uncharacterized protein B0T15DRAFT_210095 [Chaetomium strumarium]|uniref:Letm1 RBD domain-containing protein n=1 Tax=Chaetomium strumarium TaxID=1170767 RepID=A0AAJ0M1R5_9PEZI|nr:hypothetical protein B0T15DRAFT_210095 [Chaetomium strumarium]